MEAFATYLMKSSVWLTGFALVYALFLRNERFFVLNRIYLVSGILISIIFPFFTWHYTVVLPIVPTAEVYEPQVQGITAVNEPFPTQNVLLLVLYISGIIYLVYRILRQTLPVFRIIRKSEPQHFSSAKLIRTAEYPASFSFFSFVFVNPSIDEIETNEIVNHELEHIRQQHWIDLLLFEILRTIQWFNPAIWLYGHLIRQNHEYLADERALQRSQNPAIYRAALLNQMFGGTVISLTNSFNYSLNKKRFNMMKQIINSPIRKLKLLVVLPMIAGVFYAFATPEYKFVGAENREASQQGKTISGKVISEEGKPLQGASVIVKGTTIGTITDATGSFKLEMPGDYGIIISYVGYETIDLPDAYAFKTLTMKRVSVGIDKITVIGYGKNPPPPPPPPSSLSVDSKNPPLYILDGKTISKSEMDKIDPEGIESISVLKDQSATAVYGEKGKNGVIDIKLKTTVPPTSGNVGTQKNIKEEEVFVAVEEMPEFSGGVEALRWYLARSVKYPVAAAEKWIQGQVLVKFVVTKTGKVANASIAKGVDPSLDKEAVRVVQSMPDWKPGKQRGVNVDVSYTIPIEFVLQSNTKSNEKSEITNKSADNVFAIVEEMPSFPGGTEALNAFINANLKYPTIALENGIRGQVNVGFVVGKNGGISNVKVTRGVDPAIDKEAMRIVKAMPNWKPGKQGGENVDVTYELPINFKIPADYHPISPEKLRAMGTVTKTTDQTLQLSIVPNPTSDYARITLDGSESTNKLEINVYNSSGKLIKNASKNGSTFSLSINNLPVGKYLVVGKDVKNELTVTVQLVVNR